MSISRVSISRWLLALCTALPLLTATVPAAADDFPPITEEEKALTAESLKSKEPAIILFRKGEFHMQDLGKSMADSRLVVRQRLKVLTEEGKEYAEIRLFHSSTHRLRELKGRTVLPDGRILPLQVTGKQQWSQKDPYFTTVAAFDGVEVGAILDYEYVLRYDSFYHLEPWYFQDRIPTRHSEFSVFVPPHIGVKPWARETMRETLRFESKEISGKMRQFRAWAENLPAIPLEPFGYPFPDLATQYLVLPTQYVQSGYAFDDLSSWKQVNEDFQNYWKGLRRGGARSRGKALAAKESTLQAKAAAVYRFVRDEIRTEHLDSWNDSVDKVLDAGRGNSYQKALLLHAMLDGAGLDAQMVRASTRDNGTPDMKTPNPGWFDTTLVHLVLDGKPVFLLPTDRGLAFGELPPNLENTQALIFHKKDAEIVSLPTSPFTDHTRDASVRLAVDEEGRVTGSGTLLLGGHRAWQYLPWKDTPEATAEAWREWLQEKFSAYKVSDVTVEEAVDERRVKVQWQLQQSAEEALGDEATIQPSIPLGPRTQMLPVPPEGRRTPVLIEFPYRDEVFVTLTWPAGWDLDLQPENLLHESGAGSVETTVEVDRAERRLTYTRYFQIEGREYHGRQNYGELRNLFAAGEKQDAQPIVLVRR